MNDYRNEDTPVRAVIIGGGIAGPATALSLRRAGIDVTVLERRPKPESETGSYLTLSPNGLAALDALDARSAVQAAGFASGANTMFGATGRHLGTLSLGPPLPDGTVGFTLKRARLALVLAEQAQDEGARLHWDAEVSSLLHAGSEGVVELVGGQRFTADVVIGADGVHSRTRRFLDPNAPAARYVGLTNFGGVTPSSAVTTTLEPERWHFVFGRRCFFGAHPMPGGDIVWFVNTPEPEITADVRARTSAAQWLTHLADLVAGDSGPAAELIPAGRLELSADNTYDLAHVPVWQDGRVVIVGDAAHAPAPSSGQGASMALEDAVVLGHSLRDQPDVRSALVTYERMRRDRVERIVKAGAQTSSAKIPGPVGRRLQEAVMRFAFRHIVTEQRTAWMTGYRVEADLNLAVD